jgi:acyl phosphate:glycerol-3-phosphate acyltransferase
MVEGIRPIRLFVAGATGFAVGSINPATLVARTQGVDLRQVGSGNPGATNLARAMGRRAGVIVGAIDVAKGLVPAAAFGRWGAMAGEVAGLSAVLGHIFSPFLRGRGGKGVATTLGAVVGVKPVWAIPMLAAFGATFAGTHRVGIGAVAGSAVLVGIGLWGTDSAEEQAFAITLGVVVILRHQGNVRGLFQGPAAGVLESD